MQRVTEFAKEQGYEIRRYSINNTKILLLDETGKGVDEKDLRRYADEQEKVVQRGINAN